MATLQQYRANIQLAIAELRATREQETSRIIHDEIALIKSRVINTGESADGGNFGVYSEALVPYWFHGSSVKNADFNVKEKQKEILKKKGYHSSYKDWREINNRPTAFKNFSFTNEMFAGIEPIVVAADLDSTSYVLGSTNPEAQKKINFNKARDGDFLAQSESERQLIRTLNLQRVYKVFAKYNLV